ncbi:dihydrodipicolinate synthase family protein [Actinomycetes bacterium KLBMP 9797]
MKFDLSGVIVATTLAFRSSADAPAGLAVDYERFAAHCDWLISSGCRGVGPNGSLGEYSSLTDAERRKVVQVAVEAVGGRGLVVAGVHGVGWHQARHWAELAKEDGADAVLLLPPIVYRASESEVIEHYTRVAEVGLPIMVYNNPIDTKVDIVPSLVAKLYEIPEVVAIKEFSGDVRRVLEIKERCDIDVIAGADDLLFESLVCGAVGWFAGYPNAFPAEAVELYELVRADRVAEARELYRHLAPAFRWDSRTEFVQAIKLSVDIVGRSYGGPTRPPRGPLTPHDEAQVRADMKRALDYLSTR